jgi:hypothetical protein
VDAVCAGFALWTLCAHAVVAMGGSLRSLVWLYAVAGAAALGLWWAWRRHGSASAPEPDEAPAPPRGRGLRILQGAGLVGGAGAALAFHFLGNVVALWSFGVALLAAAAVGFVLLEPPRFERAARGAALEAGLWLLALGCAALALAVHRPDIDDAFYVNLAVSAADFPERQLLAGDTLHGGAELPLLLPVYRFHSYELWNGMLAWLSGRPAIEVFHWLSAALAALLVPLAHARALRWLVPRDWLWATAALVFVLLAAGETHRWYGNFAFVRIWQGKGIYLFVFLPLIYAYAVEFARRPTPGAGLRLAAAQIAALGCSSSAFWGAPAAAWMALCCALRPTFRDLPRFAAGALTSLYVVGVGWIAKGIMRSGGHTPSPHRLVEAYPGARLEEALGVTLGTGRLLAAGVLAWLASWAFCRRGLGQRFAIVVPLAVGGILLNPWLGAWVVGNVTSSSHWRVMWALPLPMLLAFVLISPLAIGRHGRPRALAAAASLALLAAFAAFVPAFGGLSPQNAAANGLDLRVGRPDLKVDTDAWRWAQALNDAVPAGSTVIAPSDVGVWLPTLRRHVRPLEVRSQYLRDYREELGDQVRIRHLLGEYVEGVAEDPEGAAVFRTSLDRFGVRAVLLRRSPRTAEARAILREQGFRLHLRAPDHEIWVRPTP